MTNEAKDKLLREKINMLDPLSGGIVFGKEEAWEKLQTRMEHKPVKKIALKYWFAAAAALLLFLCIAVIYRTPQQEIARSESGEIPKQNIAVVNARVAEQPANTAQQITSSATVVKKHVVNAITTRPAVEASVIINIPQQQVTQNETKADQHTATINTPAPVQPSPQPMKVIHIDDLERKNSTPQAPAIALVADPTIDVSKLPVVHINEVVRQDIEVKAIRRENRMSYGRHVFFRPVYNDNHASGEQEDYPSTNPFKTIFKIQN